VSASAGTSAGAAAGGVLIRSAMNEGTPNGAILILVAGESQSESGEWVLFALGDASQTIFNTGDAGVHGVNPMELRAL
jgi:hypothetical protein